MGQLIEGATFSAAFGAKCPASELPLFAPTFAPGEHDDHALLQDSRREVQSLLRAPRRPRREGKLAVRDDAAGRRAGRTSSSWLVASMTCWWC